ncbi:twin-arginine translocation protein TatA [Vibrio sp. RC586]|uniref:twin-arginine translocase TatA/TatE family subunit n=1 Tax=Vibrio sp. RC586 TaxID=675815 RepID=UPI0001BB86D3|nr:twin-arginine translocase TatA/TatE family subunit [Vibrio sp. RC586]EEY99214.1 twin-arginine translocation protein TatA [Vibrio sp. RC586]
MGGISVGKLLILGCIVALVFGTKKLRTIGEDAGYAIRSFQKALRGDAVPSSPLANDESVESTALEQDMSQIDGTDRHS